MNSFFLLLNSPIFGRFQNYPCPLIEQDPKKNHPKKAILEGPKTKKAHPKSNTTLKTIIFKKNTKIPESSQNQPFPQKKTPKSFAKAEVTHRSPAPPASLAWSAKTSLAVQSTATELGQPPPRLGQPRRWGRLSKLVFQCFFFGGGGSSLFVVFLMVFVYGFCMVVMSFSFFCLIFVITFCYLSPSRWSFREPPIVLHAFECLACKHAPQCTKCFCTQEIPSDMVFEGGW